LVNVRASASLSGNTSIKPAKRLQLREQAVAAERKSADVFIYA